MVRINQGIGRKRQGSGAGGWVSPALGRDWIVVVWDPIAVIRDRIAVRWDSGAVNRELPVSWWPATCGGSLFRAVTRGL